MSVPPDHRSLRVALVLTSLGRAGAQRQVVATARGLTRLGHDVTVVTLRGRADLDSDVVETGAGLVHLGRNGRFGGLVGRLGYRREVDRIRPDVIYSFMPAANVTTALLGRRPERPRLVWGIRDSGTDQAPLDLKSRGATWLAGRLARRPGLIISNSHAAVEYYSSRGYPRSRFVVIPNGIDVDRFAPEPQRRRAERAARGFRDGELILVCVGRTDPMKGHDVLLEAFAMAAERDKRIRLWIVGAHGADWASAYLAEAERLGVADRVSVDDAIAEPERVYNAADALVSASLYAEGFSNVIAEALACGVPVAVTNVGDAARIVGPHGVVAAPGDVVSLVDAMTLAVASIGRGDMERRAHVVQHYSLDRLAERTERALVAVNREACTSG